MKKASLVNLIVIIGILVLCVGTLVVIYATAPESSVMLLEEDFDNLDEDRWRHEVADCEEDGDQYQYVTADGENGLIADGVLHIYPNMTGVRFRTGREARGKCNSCVNSENSTVDCNHLFSAKVQTKNAYEASRGRVEVRARICCGQHIKLNIEIKRDRNNSEDDFEGITERTNGSEVRVFFGSSSNGTVMTSPIAGDRFHLYEIEWDEARVSLKIDGETVDEKSVEEDAIKEENISNATVKLDSAPISKAFYFSLGAEAEGEEDTHAHSEGKRSSGGFPDSTQNNTSSAVEVDHVRIFRILN